MLDLRANGGGLLDEAVLISSLFVPNGTIVTTKGRTRPKRVFEATGETVTRKPIVVLVDHDTASASEIIDRGPERAPRARRWSAAGPSERACSARCSSFRTAARST